MPAPPATSPRLHEWILRIGLVMGSLVAGLGVLELALRATGTPTGVERFARRMVAPDGTSVLDCYSSNPRGTFDIDLRRADSRATYRHLAPHRYDRIAQTNRWAVEIRYNNLGFRDAPPRPKPPGVRRVVVLGDSFTEGQGVREADTTPRVLARLLDPGGSGALEVWNCGRRGLDFPQLHTAFLRALRLEPDLVVYALVLNDAAQSPEFRARQAFLDDWIMDRSQALDAPPPLLRSRLFEFALDRLTRWQVARDTTRWYLDMWSEANPDGWRDTRALIRLMRARLGQLGARLLVAPWPLLVGLDGPYPFGPVHDAIGRACRAADIEIHDLLPAFRGRVPEQLWVHPTDRHPNERAHRIAAEALAPAVQRLLARASR